MICKPARGCLHTKRRFANYFMSAAPDAFMNVRAELLLTNCLKIKYIIDAQLIK